MKEVLLIAFADIGYDGSYGKRVYKIFNYDKSNIHKQIICRASKIKNKDIFSITILRVLDRFLLGISIYILNPITSKLGFRLHLVKFSRYLFQKYLIHILKKIDLNSIDVIHFWDSFPEVFKFVKEINPKIKLYQDMPMALVSITKTLKDFDSIFPAVSQELSEEQRNSFDYVDKFIVPSNFVKDSLLWEGISEKKIKIIPFGVDINEFKPKKIISKKLKFAFSGNVNNRKGVNYLLQAWKELDLKDCELNIYGRVYPEIKLNYNDEEKYNIKFHGFVDLRKELPKNDVYIFPTLLEGSAKSVYEALACGLPVITTYNSGSIIKDGKEGFIIDVQNVKVLKEKIFYFYNNEDKLQDFSKRARKLAKKYTWELYANSINNSYLKND